MDIPVPTSHDANAEATRTLRVPEMLPLLRRNLAVIAICAIACAACAWGFASSRPARYSASATIAIEGQSFAIPELEGAIRNSSPTDPMPAVRTEVQALMSRQLVQSVIARLGLDRLAEFNPALRPPTVLQHLRQQLQRVFPMLASSMLRRSLPAPAGGGEAVENRVLKALVVSQDNQSLVIGVQFTCENPRLAASFVNDLIDAYLVAQAARRTTANRGANAEMVQRIDEVRTGLAKLEQQMRDLRTRNGLVGLPVGSIGQQQVQDLASAAARASLDRADLEAKYRRAVALAKQGFSGDVDNVLSSETITRLREQESAASEKLADLEANDGPGNPSVRAARANLRAASAEVAEEAQRIVSSLGAQLAVARTREADTQSQLQSARQVGLRAENNQAELNELQQEVTAQRALYQSLLEDAQRTAAQSANPSQDLEVRLLSRAEPPATPSSPRVKLATGMGGAGGTAIGILIALIRGRADLLWTAADVAGLTGLTVAAIIPGRRSRRGLLSRVRADPAGAEAEALRLLRTRLRATGRTGVRSVLFVSLDDDGEAASVAAAFAYVAAADGEKIVLAEGNLAAPRLAGLLGIRRPGLLGVLEGDADWHDVLLRDQSVQLDILATEDASSTPNLLLGNARLQNLLSDLHDAYHLAVMSGPAAASSEALALAAEASTTVLVIHAERSGATAVRECAGQLSNVSGGRPASVFVTAR